jgi:hypothetical protein
MIKLSGLDHDLDMSRELIMQGEEVLHGEHGSIELLKNSIFLATKSGPCEPNI